MYKRISICKQCIGGVSLVIFYHNNCFVIDDVCDHYCWTYRHQASFKAYKNRWRFDIYQWELITLYLVMLACGCEREWEREREKNMSIPSRIETSPAPHVGHLVKTDARWTAHIYFLYYDWREFPLLLSINFDSCVYNVSSPSSSLIEPLGTGSSNTRTNVAS